MLLEADGDQVVAIRSGKISRSHYARKLGVPPSALSWYLDVFDEYEQRLGVATGPLRHIEEMRAWLAHAFDSGNLRIRDGKVDRAEFQRHFKLKGGNFLTRYPEIRELFDHIDRRAATEGYLAIADQEALTRIEAALDGPVTLNKDRMTISKVWLSSVTGVPPHRLDAKPFAEALSARQAQVTREVEASRIDPFVGGRVYAFSDLAPLWSRTLLERIGSRFKQTAGGFAEPKALYLQMLNALAWIGRSGQSDCRAVVAEAAKRGRIVSVERWEEALFSYRDHLIGQISTGAMTESGVDGRISALRMMLEVLSSGQVIPATPIPLPGVKHARRLGGHRPSVAEAGAIDQGGMPDYVAFARERFLEACRSLKVEIPQGDSEEFLRGITAELQHASDLPATPVEAVRHVLERRLSALRTAAKRIVAENIDAYERGRELLDMASIDGAAFENAYLAARADRFEQRKLVRRFFPDPEGTSQDVASRGAANLLSLIKQRCDGLPPGNNIPVQGYGQFFAKRYLEYGGLRTIAPMLLPVPEVSGAALTLYLIESGANVSVGRTMDRDCSEKSDLDGHRRITGFKARAAGKPIIVDIPEDSSAVRAMDWLASVSTCLSVHAGEDNDRLFLQRIGDRVQLMTPHWFTNWFKRLAASEPALAHIRLVPSMIRPSVLLHAALSNDGRLMVGMAIGQHGLGVTRGYQVKWPTKLLYDQNIARFLKAFETLVMSGIEDAASKLGITPEEFAERLNDLRPTGLGTFCKDPRGRPGEQEASCSQLDCWNDCPNLLILAEVEAIAAMQIWQRSLREVQGDWERDRPERWGEVWLPWLCLTDVVEMKLSRGPLIKTWKQACLRADELLSDPNFVPPRPW
ncbi:MAG TPA: hypothetical protein DEP91_00885 [Sphingomonas bacterium]|jgi:hypothetical protein|uniref:Uncharacterized protein n=1 Tax=Sphingomonas bacterium TaxID=1895847 RepID=A0A3D0W7M5_9SPHN|nr:hypothetical protein [Sphingomonas bacterium]